VLNAVAVCITMQSMLASSKKKERYVCLWLLVTQADVEHFRPEGNDRYVRGAPANPKLTRWHYDDDVSPSAGAQATAERIDCMNPLYLDLEEPVGA
jgi:hypothetical protein